MNILIPTNLVLSHQSQETAHFMRFLNNLMIAKFKILLLNIIPNEPGITTSYFGDLEVIQYGFYAPKLLSISGSLEITSRHRSLFYARDQREDFFRFMTEFCARREIQIIHTLDPILILPISAAAARNALPCIITLKHNRDNLLIDISRIPPEKLKKAFAAGNSEQLITSMVKAGATEILNLLKKADLGKLINFYSNVYQTSQPSS